MTWSHKGNMAWSAWHEEGLLDDSPHYLKGGRTGPKGMFQTTGKGEWHAKGKSKAKGKTKTIGEETLQAAKQKANEN
jgi:hypothetical protein